MADLELAQYRTLIEKMPIMDQASASKVETWRHYKSQQLSVMLNDFAESDGTTVSVSRRDVFDMARHGITPHFVYATYIWGYPNGNRGRYRQVFEHMGKILARLRGIPSSIDQGDWNRTYRELAKGIGGLNVSTWTKLLYFLRIQIGGRRALILDGKLIAVFRRRVFCEFESLAGISYDSGPRRYIDYLQNMYDAAETLNVDPAKLEMFLFTFGNALKNHTADCAEVLSAR